MSCHKEIGTITAVGSPLSSETYWISASGIVYTVLRFRGRRLAVREGGARQTTQDDGLSHLGAIPRWRVPPNRAAWPDGCRGTRCGASWGTADWWPARGCR